MLFSKKEYKNFNITNPTDNIGNRDFSAELRYPQIDAVYTWVNGSDPIWLKEMQKYKYIYNMDHNIQEEVKGDSATSANRFRDNDELKYDFQSYLTVGTVYAHLK